MARVLIADDDAQYLAAFSDAMATIGHEVVGYRTRGDTLSALERDGFDVVFLDVLMPGGGAIGLIHEIRGLDAAVPIVVITGNEAVFHSPIVSDGLRLANARMRKSASLDQLDALVKDLTAPA